MFGRRRIAITNEGWHYLFVLAFIVGGASLREVNLLVALASMMIGAFLINALFAFTTSRRLKVRRRSPRRIFSGEPFTMEVSVQNLRQRIGVWTITIRDRLYRAERPQNFSQTTYVDSFLMRIKPQETRHVSYRCMLPHRGRYAAGPLEISTGFPFGLVRGRRRVEGLDELLVYPRLGRLTTNWARNMQTQRVGEQYAGKQRGWNDGDYYGIREWRPGDAQRWIHWRATAKLNELAVRQFEQPDSRDTIVVLDLWRAERYGPEQQEVVERAVSFYATVVTEACRHNTGRLLAGAAAEERSVRLAETSSTLMWEWLDWLATAEPSNENQLLVVLAEMQRRAPPNAELVVISTRTEDARPVFPKTSAESAIGNNQDATNITWIDCGGDQWEGFFQWR